MSVPVVDLFAGAGGLGEGFSQVGWREGNPYFRLAVSVEKDAAAHSSLKLRSFFRQFPFGAVPKEYYDNLKEGQNPEGLFTLEQYSNEARNAENEALSIQLGNLDDREIDRKLDMVLEARLRGGPHWVLIGGPPCQAYSVVGRVRRSRDSHYNPEHDKRHFLYQEYLG